MKKKQWNFKELEKEFTFQVRGFSNIISEYEKDRPNPGMRKLSQEELMANEKRLTICKKSLQEELMAIEKKILICKILIKKISVNKKEVPARFGTGKIGNGNEPP